MTKFGWLTTSIIILLLFLNIYQGYHFSYTQPIHTFRNKDDRGFRFLTISNEVLSDTDFFKDRSLLVMHINTDCDLCQEKISAIIKYIHEFKNTDIILASSEPVSVLREFDSKNNISSYPQIHLVTTDANYFQKTFGSAFIPLVVIYDKNGAIVKKIDDVVPFGILVKYVRLANEEKG